MDNEELKGFIKNVKRRLVITKVVATRSVKTKRGDFFAGFAAAWDTTQDDTGGPGADMDMVMDTSEVAVSGMSLKEAVVAHNILAMQVDQAAYKAARANGAMSASEYNDAIQATKANYGMIIRDALLTPEKGNGK